MLADPGNEWKIPLSLLNNRSELHLQEIGGRIRS